jgi:polar amino acid transport system substrate-binding protein
VSRPQDLDLPHAPVAEKACARCAELMKGARGESDEPPLLGRPSIHSGSISPNTLTGIYRGFAVCFRKKRLNGVETMFKKISLLIFTTTLFFIISSIVNAQTVLRIAYPTFPPFHWVNENGEVTGFFYEIITEALEKRMGLTVVWTAYPWTRCQENLKNGKDDAVMTVPTAERAAYTLTHQDPFYEKTLNLFTYVDHPRIEEIKNIRRIADLKEGSFSVITYSGNGWHEENVLSLGIKTHETSYLENTWKMLAEKRGDTVIEWPPGAWPDIVRMGVSDRIIDTTITISAMPFHLLIRKDSPSVSVLADFNDTINRMKEDGTMALILSKYY